MSSSWRAFTCAFVTYSGSYPSFRDNCLSTSVIDEPSTMGSISAGTVNCHASAVTVRIRSREYCISQSHIGSHGSHPSPQIQLPEIQPGAGPNRKHRFGHRYDRDLYSKLHEPALPSPLALLPDDRLRRALDQSSIKWHGLAVCGMIDKPGHENNQCGGTSPQHQQNTHPHFTFAGFTAACTTFSCGVGAVSRTITSVTTSAQITRPHMPSIALFISAPPLHR